MTLEELTAIIRRRLRINVARHYEEFCARSASGDLRQFVQYLRDNGIVDAALYAELQGHDGIELTAFGPDGEAAGHLTFTEQPTAVMEDDPRAKHAALLHEPDPTGPDSLAVVDESREPPRYVLLGLLGKGAMGEVHVAQDVYLRRKVAFKHLLPTMATQPSVFARFLGEMQVTSQLDHPNIVPVYGLEVGPDGTIAYAMKLVRGRELARLLAETRERLQRGEPLDEEHGLEQRLDCFLKVCDAISFAHDKGIVHRDLKPANIMIGHYHEVYVMDWGICRVIGCGDLAAEAGVELCDLDESADEHAQRTRLGTAVGTPCYMSPEQAAGRNDELDGRSDQYSLGIILQELVTLERVVPGTTMREVFENAKQAVRLPPVPNKLGLAVPRELGAIIAKATRKTPSDRYPSVAELAADVRRFLRGEGVVAEPDRALQRLARWVGRHRMTAVGALAVTLLVAIAAMAIVGLLSREQTVVAEAHARELALRADKEHLAELVTQTALLGHRLDQTLGRHESELEQLVGAVEELLGHAPPSNDPLHFADEFDSPGGGPDDLAPSAVYRARISVAWPVFVVPSAVDREAVMLEARKLAWLRPTLRSILLDSRFDDGHRLSEAVERRAIAVEGTPIRRVMVTLSNGLHVAMPGMGGHSPDRDARRDPSYVLARVRPGMQWGQPRRDGTGQGVVLRCSAALHDGAEQLVGVAAIELDVERALGPLLASAQLASIERTLLVDLRGTILLQRDHRAPPEAARAASAIRLGRTASPLPAEVIRAIAKREAGYLERRTDRRRLYAYQPLESADWSFVVVADADVSSDGTESPVEPAATTDAATAVRSRMPAAASSSQRAARGAETVTLEVLPPFASVTVDGTARPLVEGRVTLTGPVGSRHSVVVTVAGEESSYEVTITERGPRPWQVLAEQLRPGERVPGSTPSAARPSQRGSPGSSDDPYDGPAPRREPGPYD